ncbi:hypothetical protein BJI69_18190 [Luteibacter rhizovicinus DSM 16549]|uniref:Uncharacterized protein n=1 Tax=Luteibacter rhizovicinus DSM 16549 TaxID=1440763 RepID=A0A0G9HH52_9GAMM|nr:hypothetical protein [Luteibacter rhizovicinus]APG05643.1 hypothetical protein BJI69_18190 [Luteibacter rhizovicinus DSM 16549]KLD66977.1 hypothetical protein Y883_10370 [Luteibacter rhizovicinus DSM 16549]KLD75274.1 hypothetical protein Y886_28010 [Xanthomonas hyacinthi DSM 19077]
MPKTKKWLIAAIAITYVVAALLSILIDDGSLSESTRASILNVVDLFGVSGRLSSESSFPHIAQVYFSFCILLYPMFFVFFMLAFWAPTLPSYAERIRGMARIQFFLGGLFLSGIGVLLPAAIRGQDSRLFPIGSSTWGLIGFGWMPYAGGALALALGLSALFRSLRT